MKGKWLVLSSAIESLSSCENTPLNLFWILAAYRSDHLSDLMCLVWSLCALIALKTIKPVIVQHFFLSFNSHLGIRMSRKVPICWFPHQIKMSQLILAFLILYTSDLVHLELHRYQFWGNCISFPLLCLSHSPLNSWYLTCLYFFLSWANRDDVWKNMLNKEQTYVREKHYMQKHPLLQPKMRTILLDWLMEVSFAVLGNTLRVL